MSHVPRGLVGGTPDPVGVCCAIVKVEPTRVRTSGSKCATSILIFIVILSALKNLLRRPNKTESRLVLAAEFLRTFCPDYVYHLILLSLHLAPPSRAVYFTDI
jgi:hypothetical protein